MKQTAILQTDSCDDGDGHDDDMTQVPRLLPRKKRCAIANDCMTVMITLTRL